MDLMSLWKNYSREYNVGMNGIYGVIKNNSELYLFQKNIFNDIVAIYQNESTLVAQYEYEDFGKVTVKDSSGNIITDSTHIGKLNPFRYRSYYYDQETNLYYCLTRYYHPSFRRWLNMDDVSNLDAEHIDGINLFAYCNNNPIMFSDENGEFAINISLLLIGGLVGFGSAFYKDILDDWTPFNGSIGWKEYVGATIGGMFSGLEGGFLFSMISGGISSVVEAGVSENIESFFDFFKFFGIGSAIGAIGFGLEQLVNLYAKKHIMGIIGQSTKHSIINKRLAEAGFKNLKIGKLGFEKLYKTLFERLGYKNVETWLKISYELFSSFLPSYIITIISSMDFVFLIFRLISVMLFAAFGVLLGNGHRHLATIFCVVGWVLCVCGIVGSYFFLRFCFSKLSQEHYKLSKKISGRCSGGQHTLVFTKKMKKWTILMGKEEISFDLRGLVYKKSFIKSFVTRAIRYPRISNLLPTKTIKKIYLSGFPKSLKIDVIFLSKNKSKTYHIIKKGVSKQGFIEWFMIRVKTDYRDRTTPHDEKIPNMVLPLDESLFNEYFSITYKKGPWF